MSRGLVWLRNDLRIGDNPALWAALERCAQVDAVYINETDDDIRKPGGARRIWIDESLRTLSETLARLGVNLTIERGSSAEILMRKVSGAGYDGVFWNRRYGQSEQRHDANIKASIRNIGRIVASFNGSLLVEPWDLATKSGTPYGVFTPFWNSLRTRHIPPPLPAPTGSGRIEVPASKIAFNHPDWARSILAAWKIGESAAQDRLAEFLDDTLPGYSTGRNFPDQQATSRLSPHLATGEISARQIWHATQYAIDARPEIATEGAKFLSELAWREFSYHLLFHRDDITNVPMQARFADIEWQEDTPSLYRWQKGQTGIPIIDAGMRQLWATGWMHNRVRMLAGSLLAKNLLIDWRHGERWFWDTLVDADAANNPASWQWVAGCGADAAPYFRVFNPVIQGEKFDPAGTYVRQWVPELANLPAKYLHRPWEAPRNILDQAGIRLGSDYPEPVVDLGTSRTRALEALGRHKSR